MQGTIREGKLSQDAERIKRLIAFKKKLETRIEELSSDLKDSQAMLETINSILIEKGFKRLEPAKPAVQTASSQLAESTDKEEHEPPPPQSPAEAESVTPLKNMTGELLANLYIAPDSLRVVPAQDKEFDVNTPPFMHFLVERVLLKMQERDSELVKAGQLSPDRVFCYNIVRDGDKIREITINNSDQDRLRELKSSIRWTLEKMLEKMKGQT
jgi:hypothetical protein